MEDNYWVPGRSCRSHGASGKRLLEFREVKDLSQQELTKLMNTSYAVIGKYDRDETIPSIDVAENLGLTFGEHHWISSG